MSDLPSESESSDEDFCPEDEASDIPSEEESDYDEPEDNVDNREAELIKTKRKGRRSKEGNGKNSERLSNNLKQNSDATKNAEFESDDENEKKRSDDLWASFLSDVDDSSKNEVTQRTKSDDSKCKKPEVGKLTKNDEQQPKVEKVKVTKIFDFAGEEVKVTKEVPAETVKPESSLESNTKKAPTNLSKPLKRPAGGLSSVLNSINKKNKISVLEKTKLDWDQFKQSEGLNEELQSFNKGKDGYLERQDFLERTDLRQFELEKSLRQSRRSNR